MTSWLTVKESSECMLIDDEDSDAEPSEELGLFKLRSIYTTGLTLLHGSEVLHDEGWHESRIRFQDIIRLADDTTDETAAARSECQLLLFLAHSNLSRMLAKSSEKKEALTYALSAASMMSVGDGALHDPGLLLRIAKLALDVGDVWSCKQIIGYRMSQENHICGGSGFLDSFYQLSDQLHDKLSERSSSYLIEDSEVTCSNVISLQFEKAALNSTASDNCSSAFDKLAVILEAQSLLGSLDYSFQRYAYSSSPSSSPPSSSSSSAGGRRDSSTASAFCDSETQRVHSVLVNSNICAMDESTRDSPVDGVMSDTSLVSECIAQPAQPPPPTDSERSINAACAPAKPAEVRKSRSSTIDLKVSSEIGAGVGRRRREMQNQTSSMPSKFSALQDILTQDELTQRSHPSSDSTLERKECSSSSYLKYLELFLHEGIPSDRSVRPDGGVLVPPSPSNSGITYGAGDLSHGGMASSSVSRTGSDSSYVPSDPPSHPPSAEGSRHSMIQDAGRCLSKVKEKCAEYLEEEISFLNKINEILSPGDADRTSSSVRAEDISIHTLFIATATAFVAHHVLAHSVSCFSQEKVTMQKKTGAHSTTSSSSSPLSSDSGTLGKIEFQRIRTSVLVSWIYVLNYSGLPVSELLQLMTEEEILLLAECSLDFLFDIKYDFNAADMSEEMRNNEELMVITELDDSAMRSKGKNEILLLNCGWISSTFIRILFIWSGEKVGGVGNRDTVRVNEEDVGVDAVQDGAEEDRSFESFTSSLRRIRRAWVLVGYGELLNSTCPSAPSPYPCHKGARGTKENALPNKVHSKPQNAPHRSPSSLSVDVSPHYACLLRMLGPRDGRKDNGGNQNEIDRERMFSIESNGIAIYLPHRLRSWDSIDRRKVLSQQSMTSVLQDVIKHESEWKKMQGSVSVDMNKRKKKFLEKSLPLLTTSLNSVILVCINRKMKMEDTLFCFLLKCCEELNDFPVWLEITNLIIINYLDNLISSLRLPNGNGNNGGGNSDNDSNNNGDEIERNEIQSRLFYLFSSLHDQISKFGAIQASVQVSKKTNTLHLNISKLIIKAYALENFQSITMSARFIEKLHRNISVEKNKILTPDICGFEVFGVGAFLCLGNILNIRRNKSDFEMLKNTALSLTSLLKYMILSDHLLLRLCNIPSDLFTMSDGHSKDILTVFRDVALTWQLEEGDKESDKRRVKDKDNENESADINNDDNKSSTISANSCTLLSLIQSEVISLSVAVVLGSAFSRESSSSNDNSENIEINNEENNKNNGYSYSSSELYQVISILHECASEENLYRADEGLLGSFSSKIILDWLIGTCPTENCDENANGNKIRSQISRNPFNTKISNKPKLLAKQLKESLIMLGQIYALLYEFPMTPPFLYQDSDRNYEVKGINTPLTIDVIHQLYTYTLYCESLGNVFGKTEVRACVAILFKCPAIEQLEMPPMRGCLDKVVFSSPIPSSSSPSSSSSATSSGPPLAYISPFSSSVVFEGKINLLRIKISEYSLGLRDPCTDASPSPNIAELLSKKRENDIRSSIYHDVIRLGVPYNLIDDESTVESPHVLFEGHVCWVIETCLRDLSHSPTRFESWFTLHTKLSEWLQRICDELGEILIPDKLPPAVHRICLDGSLERILGGRYRIGNSFKGHPLASPSSSSASSPPRSSLPVTVFADPAAGTHSLLSSNSCDGDRIGAPDIHANGSTHAPVLSSAGLVAGMNDTSSAATSSSSTILDSQTLPRKEVVDQWTQHFGSPKEFFPFYNIAGVFPKEKEKENVNSEKEKEKEKKIGAEKMKDKEKKLVQLNESNAKIVTICNLLTLKNSVLFAVENVFEFIAKSFVVGEEGSETSTETSCSASNSSESPSLTDPSDSSDASRTAPTPLLANAEDMKTIFENHGLSLYNITREYSKEHSSEQRKEILRKSYVSFSKACRFSNDESPFLLLMCGKLSWQLDRNLKNCFRLLSLAYEVNEKRSISVTASVQKQLRVLVLYQISSIRAKILLQSFVSMKDYPTHNNCTQRNSNDPFIFNEECSLPDDDMEIIENTCLLHSLNMNTSMAINERKSNINDEKCPENIDKKGKKNNNNGSNGRCDNIENAGDEINKNTKTATANNEYQETRISKNHRYWKALSTSLSGLIECRKIDPYHSLSVHRISTIIAVLAANNIHPPEGLTLTPPLCSFQPPSSSSSSSSTSSTFPLSQGAATSTLESSSQLQPPADVRTDSQLDNSTDNSAPLTNNEHTKILGSSFHFDISASCAFSESSKLFDKKRTQIVALWCLETATNGGERILQRTYKFDSLRRKFILHYFKIAVLGDNVGAILTILTWTLGVSSRTMTATLHWIVGQAVASCSLIFNEKWVKLKHLKELFMESKVLSGVDSASIGLHSAPVCHLSQRSDFSVENFSMGNIAIASMEVDGSSDNNNNNNDNKSDGKNIAGSNGENYDQAAPLDLLKRTFDLYNLVSKVLKPSEIENLQGVMTRLHCLTDRAVDDSRATHTSSNRRSSNAGSIDAGSSSNSQGYSLGSVEDNDAATTCTYATFQSVHRDCVQMWSTRPVGGTKRSRSGQPVPAFVAAVSQPQSRSLSQPLSLLQSQQQVPLVVDETNEQPHQLPRIAVSDGPESARP